MIHQYLTSPCQYSHRIAPYARAAHSALVGRYHRTVGQYRTSHSTILNVSTARGMAQYARSVPDSA
eukprot:2361270-Rhodomonas_salina.4